MADISPARPLPSTHQTVRATHNSAIELAVRLLKPLDGLLATGESAKAEVIANKENAQNFQVLLRLTLDNGRQSTLEAHSNRALSLGSQLDVTALSQTRLLLNLAPNTQRPLDNLDLQQLPVGSLIQGKVVAQQSSQTGTYQLVVKLLNGNLAGHKLTIDSTINLPVGSLLTAQVRGSQALELLPLSTRLDQLVVSQQLNNQQARQGSLSGLFNALSQLDGQGDMPDELRSSFNKLLGLLPDAKQLSTAQGLAKALEQSGVFLEGKLLSGQSQALGQDLKANLLRLIGQLQLGATLPLNVNATTQAALPSMLRSALGQLGQSNLRHQAMSFPLPSRLLQNMDEPADLETLLKLAAAAVSRLQTHQLSSLAQSQVNADGQLLTTWQLEVPMRDQQQVVPLQIKLQHEEPNEPQNNPKDSLWRIELAFDLDPLGPLQVQAELARGSLSSQLWAERRHTAELIQAELEHLRQRLQNAGLEVGSLSCRQGVPPRGSKTHLEQRWVDEQA